MRRALPSTVHAAVGLPYIHRSFRRATASSVCQARGVHQKNTLYLSAFIGDSGGMQRAPVFFQGWKTFKKAPNEHKKCYLTGTFFSRHLRTLEHFQIEIGKRERRLRTGPKRFDKIATDGVDVRKVYMP